MLLCQLPYGECGSDGYCKLDGACFEPGQLAEELARLEVRCDAIRRRLALVRGEGA